MELIEIIKKSDIALIEGESKLGKLTFSLYSLAQNEKIKKILILSSIPKRLMQKRINSIKNLNNSIINKIINNIELLCLKENWLDIKSTYGFDFIYEDIEKILIETNCDAVIFHRPDLIFSDSEFELAKIFLEKFIEIANNVFGNKIFITSSEKHFITNYLENYTDISLLITKHDHIREILIKHSLYPVDTNRYKFIFKNSHFILINEFEKIKTLKNKNMLIISEDIRFKKIHEYIFEKNFILDFASNLSEVIQKLENKPDIIIFQDLKNVPEFNICSVVKDKSPNSEIIFILNKDYIRTEDKMDAVQSGCYEVFCRNFNLEEYILTIEKISNNFFYSQKLKLMPPQKISTNYENFCKSIQSIYNERIFFSVVETKEFDKEIIKKLRNHDIIYINEQNNFLHLCLINVTKEMFETSLKTKLNFNNFHFIEVIEWDGKC